MVICNHRGEIDMENIVIRIHEDNLAIFNQKLADLNAKFSKKGLPLINCSMEKTEMYHVDEWTKQKFPYTLYVATLSSNFNQANLSGVNVEFEGIVSLIEKSENDKIYTFVSGMFDYNMRVGCNSHELVISLDQYVLPYTKKYNYFNSPLFLVNQSRPEYLLTDCMTAIARQHIAIPQDREMSLLDYMVSEGKAIYFAQQTLGKVADSLLMRYTAEQMDWMQKNEEHVWSYFLQSKLLYETDYMRFHNFIDDAPKTNAFRDSSPRTTDYIGWHIVSQYVERTGVSLQELFEETDAQKILSQSNYRPK